MILSEEDITLWIGQAIATLSKYYIVLTDQTYFTKEDGRSLDEEEVMEITETTTTKLIAAVDDAKGPNFPLKGSIKSFLATNNNGHPLLFNDIAIFLGTCT